MKFKSFKIFLLALLSAFIPAQTARAYSWQFADEAKTVRLRWKTGVIPIAVSTSLTKANANVKLDNETATNAVRRSLDAWEKIANVKFEIVGSDRQSVSSTGKIGDGVNLITVAQTAENLLLFAGDAEEVSARTRTFYNGRGSIVEADIVLNPYKQFSVDGSLGTFDLEATLTHEIGHLLGLEHSIVAGATMFERQGKNGTYGLPNWAARTLSEDDIAGARSIYGAKNNNAECCGAIGGKLFAAGAKGASAKDVEVWAEDEETGRVAAAVLSNADGNFRIEGLSAGRYSVFAQEYAGKKNPLFAAQTLGTFEVGKGKLANITRKLKPGAKTFDARYLGFNAQLSELAVPLNGGKSFVIYVGGKNLDPENLVVHFNSPFFSVASNALSRQDFGAEMPVLSFEVKVSPQALAGDYSVSLKSKTGEIAYLIGSLTIEDFINPWSAFAFSGAE